MDTFQIKVVASNSALVVPRQEGATIVFDVPYQSIFDVAGFSDLPHFKERYNFQIILKFQIFNVIFRILDFFDIVVQTGQNETITVFNGTCAEVRNSLGATCPIKIDWSFVKTPQFLAYTATDRYNMVRTLHTTLSSNLLLGNQGYAF